MNKQKILRWINERLEDLEWTQNVNEKDTKFVRQAQKVLRYMKKVLED